MADLKWNPINSQSSGNPLASYMEAGKLFSSSLKDMGGVAKDYYESKKKKKTDLINSLISSAPDIGSVNQALGMVDDPDEFDFGQIISSAATKPEEFYKRDQARLLDAHNQQLRGYQLTEAMDNAAEGEFIRQLSSLRTPEEYDAFAKGAPTARAYDAMLKTREQFFPTTAGTDGSREAADMASVQSAFTEFVNKKKQENPAYTVNYDEFMGWYPTVAGAKTNALGKWYDSVTAHERKLNEAVQTAAAKKAFESDPDAVPYNTALEYWLDESTGLFEKTPYDIITEKLTSLIEAGMSAPEAKKVIAGILTELQRADRSRSAWYLDDQDITNHATAFNNAVNAAIAKVKPVGK
jgi:hypothetical protein